MVFSHCLRFLGASSLIFMLGCSTEAPIVTYQIPTTVPAALTAEDTRMVAAILPQEKQAWFFKLMGRESAVDAAEAAFKEFTQNVRFNEGVPILDDLPEGWRRGADRAMRFASINIETPTQQLDLSISQLARMDDWDKLVAMNVNRWRGQVGLEPSEEEWAGAEILPQRNADPETQTDEHAPAIWVDVIGRPAAGASSMGGPMTAGGPMSGGPFSGPAGPFAQTGSDSGKAGDAVDPHAGLPREAREAIASGKMKAPGKAIPQGSKSGPETASSEDTDSKLKYDRPEGWRDGRMSVMRMAAFNVGPEDAPAEVTIITAGGDLRGNVARWMGQIRESAVPDKEVDEALENAEKLEVSGHEGQRFVLIPPTLKSAPDDDAKDDNSPDEESEEPQDSPAGGGTAIDATIIPMDNGFSLFVKMTGPVEVVQAQTEQMRAFLKSLRF